MNSPFSPELCKPSKTAPASDDWLHETKFDGYRLLTTVAASRVRLWSRNGNEWTARLPELVRAIEHLKLKSAQLDGEMIVVRDGRDDFNALQTRLAGVARDPLRYVLFDAPHLNGRSLREVPLIQRKEALGTLLERRGHPALLYAEHIIGGGPEAFQAAREHALEGIVSKRLRSCYCPGQRNGDWLKVKCRPTDHFVVIGITAAAGSRTGFGSLILARNVGKRLVYSGRVGSGLTAELMQQLRVELARVRVKTPVVDVAKMSEGRRATATWLAPALVVEVTHQGFAVQGSLRHPVFKALRLDRTSDDL